MREKKRKETIIRFGLIEMRSGALPTFCVQPKISKTQTTINSLALENIFRCWFSSETPPHKVFPQTAVLNFTAVYCSYISVHISHHATIQRSNAEQFAEWLASKWQPKLSRTRLIVLIFDKLLFSVFGLFEWPIDDLAF